MGWIQSVARDLLVSSCWRSRQYAVLTMQVSDGGLAPADRDGDEGWSWCGVRPKRWGLVLLLVTIDAL